MSSPAASSKKSSKPLKRSRSESDDSSSDDDELIKAKCKINELLHKQADKRMKKKKEKKAKAESDDDEILPGNTSLHDTVYRAARDWLLATQGKKASKDKIKSIASDVARAADEVYCANPKSDTSAAAATSSKKAKTAKEPMALFCVIGDCGDGDSRGYFVPLSRLPPIKQVIEDIEERGSEESRMYHKGEHIPYSDEDRIDELRDYEDFGDILAGCIIPLAVESLEFSDVAPLKASVQCEFFAFVQQEC